MLEKIEKYFINEKFKVVSEDVGFFFQSYKPLTPANEALVTDQTGYMMKMSGAGACLGLAIALSLRRYMPGTFGELSMKRMLMDTTLILGGYVYASKMATYTVFQNIQPTRKSLVEDCDAQYLKHMLRLREKYPLVYPRPKDLFKDVFNDEDLNKWVLENNSIAMIFGFADKDAEAEGRGGGDALTESNAGDDQQQQQQQTNQNNPQIPTETVYSFDFRQQQQQNNK